MQFVHVISINEPLTAPVAVLTRSQLWRGLVMRATSPRIFVAWLDAADIVVHGADRLARTLTYGEVVIRDQVTLIPEQSLCYDVPAQTDIPASRLVVRIEEPQAGALQVRFAYDDFLPPDDDHMAAFYNQYRHAAYEEADRDTVEKIRAFAGDGQLDR